MNKEAILQEILKRVDSGFSSLSAATRDAIAHGVRYIAIDAATTAGLAIIISCVAAAASYKLFKAGINNKETGYLSGDKQFLLDFFGSILAVGSMVAATVARNNIAIAMEPYGYLVMQAVQRIAQ